LGRDCQIGIACSRSWSRSLGGKVQLGGGYAPPYSSGFRKYSGELSSAKYFADSAPKFSNERGGETRAYFNTRSTCACSSTLLKNGNANGRDERTNERGPFRVHCCDASRCSITVSAPCSAMRGGVPPFCKSVFSISARYGEFVSSTNVARSLVLGSGFGICGG